MLESPDMLKIWGFEMEILKALEDLQNLFVIIRKEVVSR